MQETPPLCPAKTPGWHILTQLSPDAYLLGRTVDGKAQYAPLYVHSFHPIVPCRLLDMQVFTKRYRCYGDITSVPDRLRWQRYARGWLQADVARRLGIPFHVFNFKEDFARQVMDKFVRCYEAGLTPNPCIDCNRYIKFGELINKMKELGFEKIVTGHYAKVVFENGRYLLKKAEDESKDQSYFLILIVFLTFNLP